MPALSLAEAFECLQRGDVAAARQSAALACVREPQHLGWRTLYVLTLTRDGRTDEALPLLFALTRDQPAEAAHWSNLGNALCEVHRDADALAPLHTALHLGADDDAVHFGLARAHARLGPVHLGLHHVQRALAFAPDDIEFLMLQAQLLLAADSPTEARAALAHLSAQSLTDAQRTDLGFLQLELGAADRAESEFTRVLGTTPQAWHAAAGAVLALERLNRMGDARALRARMRSAMSAADEATHADRLLHVDARLALRDGDAIRAARLLLALIQRSDAGTATQTSLMFDRAGALVKAGQLDEGMQAFHQAHQLARELALARHPQLATDDLFAVLDEPLPPAPRRFPDIAADGQPAPVFVVGFPRSGTTLLEQILDAHPQLCSFDEQPFVQDIARSLYVDADDAATGLAGLDADTAAALRRRYFSAVECLTGTLQDRRPVDKNPLNLVRAGLLPHFFPDAQLVLAIRHPCDVVLSCYMQHFGAPAFAITFETLESCARMYDRVFSQWSRLAHDYALPVHLLRYEDLVADVEGRARDMFVFLQLAWSPEVLEFGARARSRVIGTPSYAQVVEPVHSGSVGRWLAYRDHFSPAAMASLQPWIERFGYPAPQA